MTENRRADAPLRYAAAACQVDSPNPADRAGIKPQVDRMLEMIDMAVEGYAPFLPVKLVVFPEFAHAAPVYPTARELLEKLAVPIPNEHTERYVEKAREYGIWIQTGSFLERDDKWPGVVFNATCLVGPEGILTKYRKVNPWIPWEVHASPHDLPATTRRCTRWRDTPIGNLGVAICYDWLFPETLRQLTANGAEVLIRVSAYMDPWGATAPMDWWTVVNRCRALENVAYVVASNQGRASALPALLLAGRQHGGGLRGPPPRPGRPGPGREDRGRPGRYRRPPPRALRPAAATRRSPTCAPRPTRCTGSGSTPGGRGTGEAERRGERRGDGGGEAAAGYS
jgi:predicted amidohydrolase